jgi:hypothetical protein
MNKKERILRSPGFLFLGGLVTPYFSYVKDKAPGTRSPVV